MRRLRAHEVRRVAVAAGNLDPRTVKRYLDGVEGQAVKDEAIRKALVDLGFASPRAKGPAPARPKLAVVP